MEGTHNAVNHCPFTTWDGTTCGGSWPETCGAGLAAASWRHPLMAAAPGLMAALVLVLAPSPTARRAAKLEGRYFCSSIFVGVIQLLPSFSSTVPVTMAGFFPVHTCPNLSDTAFFTM